MTAGAREYLITFEQSGSTTDQYGEEVEGFAESGKAYAEIFWGRGDERRQAAAEQGKQTATFKVPANNLTRALKVKDRIVFQGNWDIEGLAYPNRADVEITAAKPVS